MNSAQLDQSVIPEALKSRLTPNQPWCYFSMEFGLPNLSFAGGLGILAGDVLLEAQRLHIPFVGVTLYYPKGIRQHINAWLQVEEETVHFPPAGAVGFEQRESVMVQANSGYDHINLDVYKQSYGSAEILVLYEPGIGTLYQWETESEHRLYQEVVLGFGGYKALKQLGKHPSVIHLNESATVFGALAALDDLVTNSQHSLESGLRELAGKLLFTNHTLVPAAVASFRLHNFEKYVFPNILSSDIKHWLKELVESQHDKKLNLSTLAMALTSKLNGVSKIHARIASDGRFKRADGTTAHFTPVTNGICFDRWIHPLIRSYYHASGLVTNIDQPNPSAIIDQTQLLERKHIARTDLRNYLLTHKNQYGKPTSIPYDAKIAVWARRFAEYKRPAMLFENLDRLKEILTQYNLHIIMSGKIYLSDNSLIHKMMMMIDGNPILKERVHFVQGYGIDLAQKLTGGADIWLNTPIVGEEACGTSWMKAVGNLAMLISTRDGGVADIGSSPPPYLEVTGRSYEEESSSLYSCLEEAGSILRDDSLWVKYVTHQLLSFLQIISPERMWEEYLHLALE